MRNSLIISIGSLVIAVLIGAFAAYALARLRLPFRTAIFVALLVPMSISPIVVSIPLFARLSRMGLVNTFAGGILVYVGLRLSFTIFVLDGFFRDMPDELFQAAQVDGCGPAQLFWSIVLPLARPGLTRVAVLSMLEVWNDLLVGLLFLSNRDVIPLSAHVVAFQQRYSVDPQMIFAGLLIAAIPMVIAYVTAQRQFIEGMMAGAFK